MFYRRVLAQLLSSGVSRDKVRLLFGARQTGKTELLRHVVPADNSVRVDLTNTAERRRFEVDPSRLGREARALPVRIKALVVDEIQKVPALLDEIQSLHDEAPNRFQIYLTGSSARKLRAHSANLLPGRSHVFRLSPVSMWEEEAREAVEWPASAPPPRVRFSRSTPPPFPSQGLERTLLLGNLPGIRTESRATAAATLAGYVENFLEEEIRREALARDLGAFAVFLKLAAIESGQQVNLARLSKESGTPATTLKNYYQVLVDTFVGFWIRSYGMRGRKRLLTTPRFLFFDTGIRNAAAGIVAEASMLDAEGPRLLEQWVGLELLYRATYRGVGHDVSFWRSASGAEVDYVWQSPREDVPVEVKWTTRPALSDVRHIQRFLAEYPRRAKRGLLVCRCDRPQQLTPSIWAVPWDRF